MTVVSNAPDVVVGCQSSVPPLNLVSFMFVDGEILLPGLRLAAACDGAAFGQRGLHASHAQHVPGPGPGPGKVAGVPGSHRIGFSRSRSGGTASRLRRSDASQSFNEAVQEREAGQAHHGRASQGGYGSQGESRGGQSSQSGRSREVCGDAGAANAGKTLEGSFAPGADEDCDTLRDSQLDGVALDDAVDAAMDEVPAGDLRTPSRASNGGLPQTLEMPFADTLIDLAADHHASGFDDFALANAFADTLLDIPQLEAAQAASFQPRPPLCGHRGGEAADEEGVEAKEVGEEKEKEKEEEKDKDKEEEEEEREEQDEDEVQKDENVVSSPPAADGRRAASPPQGRDPPAEAGDGAEAPSGQGSAR